MWLKVIATTAVLGLLLALADISTALSQDTAGLSIPSSFVPWILALLLAGAITGWITDRPWVGAVSGAGVALLGLLAIPVEIWVIPSKYAITLSGSEMLRQYLSFATGWGPIGVILGYGAAVIGRRFRQQGSQSTSA